MVTLQDQNPETTMLASRLHGIRDLRLETLPRPVPGPGEVLLRVEAVGVCGSDVHYYREGRIGQQIVTGPIILGHEFSARIAALGPGLEPDSDRGLHVGQLVTVDPAISCGHCELCLQGNPNLCPNVRFCGTPPIDGVFCEYAIMPAENCYPMPSEMSAAEGAMLEPLGIALHSVTLAHLQPGQTVAVLGAGPIGLLIAAVARAAGAAEIYMTEPLAYRRDFAAQYVADAVLDPQQVDVVAEIERLTGGRGVDVAFEAAGAPETPQQAASMARIGGQMILTGIAADDTLTLNAYTIRRKAINIKPVRRMKHTYLRAIRLIQAGQVDVKPLATHFLPLSHIAEAFELVDGYQDGVLRAIVQVSQS